METHCNKMSVYEKQGMISNISEEWLSFDKTFEQIIETLGEVKPLKESTELYNWIKELYLYNIPKGKRIRGMVFVKAFKVIAENLNKNVGKEDLELARVMGWIIEILQAFAQVLDDVMDQSITRRGQLCWYQNKGVGLKAINDGRILEQGAHHLLKVYFQQKPYYTVVLDYIHEVMRLTTYGQHLDMSSQTGSNSKHKFELFIKTRLQTIYKYKTSYYTFVLPVRCALYLNSCHSEEDHKTAEEIVIKIGHLFQMNDDFLDCFGDPVIMGKVGTDIEDGKCCWPVVQALELCNENQLHVLMNNYGVKSEDSVNKVKAVYNELNLIDVYHREEDMIYKSICNDIKEIANKSQLFVDVFRYLLSKIYKREK